MNAGKQHGELKASNEGKITTFLKTDDEHQSRLRDRMQTLEPRDNQDPAEHLVNRGNTCNPLLREQDAGGWGLEWSKMQEFVLHPKGCRLQRQLQLFLW